MENLSPELKKQIDAVFEALKVKDAAVAESLKKHEEDLKTFGKVQEGTKDAMAELTKKSQELYGQYHDVQQKLATLEQTGPKRELTIGQQLVAADNFKEFCLKARSGRVSFRHAVKTITSIAGSAGAGIWSTRLPGVIEEPLRPLSIRDLLGTGTTDSNLIEWLRELVLTNNADVVSEGALKPESNITYERQDVPVRTMAHWIRASKQVLADFKLLMSLIDARMRWELRIKEEDQLLLAVRGVIHGIELVHGEHDRRDSKQVH